MKTLSERDITKLNDYFKYKSLNLPTTAKNRLQEILIDGFNGINFLIEIADKNYIPKHFSALDGKSVHEIEALHTDILKIKEFLENVNNEKATVDLDIDLVKKIFPDISESQLKQICGVSNQLQLFTLINIILDAGWGFDEITSRFFNSYFPVKNSANRLERSEIAIEVALHPERIRQLFSGIENELHSYFLFIKIFYSDLAVYYRLDQNADLIIVDAYLSEKINETENTDFTTSFICFIFSILLKESHTMFLYRSGDKSLLKSGLLIKKDLVDALDFEGLIYKTSKQLKRVEETYFVDVNDYLSDFYKNSDRLNNRVKLVASSIFVAEFGLEIDGDSLTIKRTTKLNNWEFVQIALEELDVKQEGHCLEDIMRQLNKNFPNEEFIEASIRSSIIAQKSVFISFDKKSSYGLKTWETEHEEYIKGGTMTDICLNLLRSSTKPIHYHELFLYVKKYRHAANKHSMLSNLNTRSKTKNDLEFKNGFACLKIKDHHRQIPTDKSVPSSASIIDKLSQYQFQKKKLIDGFVTQGFLAVQIESVLYDLEHEGKIEINSRGEITLRPLIDLSNTDSKQITTIREPSESDDEKEQNELIKIYETQYDKFKQREELLNLQNGHQVGIQRSKTYKRDNQIIALIKLLRGFQCQICDAKIQKRDGTYYIEAAHIDPKNNGGNEKADNIILLCPNHHKEFDYGNLENLEKSSELVSFILNGQPYSAKLSIDPIKQ